MRLPAPALVAVAALSAGAFLASPIPGVRAQQVELGIDSIEHPLFAARGVRLHVDDVRAGAVTLRIATLRLGDRRFSDVRMRCSGYRWQAQRIECRRGELTAAGHKIGLPLHFDFTPATQALDLTLEPAPSERWRVRSGRAGAERVTELLLENASLARLGLWLPEVAAAAVKGRVAGTLSWRGDPGHGTAQGKLRLTGGAFSDASGTRAADKLGATLAVTAEQLGARWSWRVELDWDKGEFYWQPWYLADGGLQLRASGALDAAVLRVDSARATLREVGEIHLDATLLRQGWHLKEARFDTGSIQLAPAAALLLAPLLDQAGAPKLAFGGSLKAGGAFAAGGLTALDVQLDEAAVSEVGQRFGASGISGPVRWRSDAQTEERLRVAGAYFGKLALGAFDVPYQAHGLRLAVPQLRIPVLDGRLLIEDFRAARKSGEWQWQLGGALEPVSMERLTSALGLPPMKGTLSASIPRVSHSASTISMDGALIVQVFDGYLSATDLKVIEPLGRVPRLTGTLDMRHLDLGQLTETFSFGNITGYLDGYVKDMELAQWRPQRFDALVISSPGDYRKRISQRAVQNISALGGAGAAAAIQRSLLRMFDEFGYAKLGMSCILRQGVCEMGGVEEAPQGYVIVKRGGLPSISVIGYNRRVDWDELLARLKRVTESNVAPIVR